VKKQAEEFRDAIFIVTEERSCPIYNIGEEFKVENFSLTLPAFKPACLYLAQEIAKIISAGERYVKFSVRGGERMRFNCGGKEEVIYFEFKKERDFITRQMQLLNDTEERRQRQHLDKYFSVLRNIDIFEPLDDDALSDLTLLLEMRSIPVDKVVINKGDPGSNLYIILKGLVSVLADDGSKVAQMGTGEIFGEMSLLSGEPVISTIHTIAPTQVAMLSVKNFRFVLKKHPVLQVFLFKMLVQRAQALTLRSGKITSGMTGELAEISIVDLLQLINSSQKTGTINLILEQGKAMVFFKDGEIVHARFLKLRDKDAVFALMGIKSGHFAYVKGIPAELSRLPPLGGFMGMMMEGLQKIDEGQAD
jgi:CRP/FNR family cyclic AMP-dependent transcriptional regulator